MRAFVLLAIVASCRHEPAFPRAQDRERVLAAAATSDGVAADLAWLAREPHMAGTAGDARVADGLAARLREAGFTVEIKSYDVYLPHPVKLAVTIGGTALAVREPAPGLDPAAPELWTWNAYSASGTASAPAVYAGFGRDADFAAVAAAGVDPRGKVCILRYGPLYRGAQVAAAERHGAAAVIFYVDPADEPTRARDSVQRGTVLYYWRHMGHPEDPAVRPAIPVVAVAADEAAKLLARLDGPPASGELATPLAPRLGPGPVVDVRVELDGRTRTIRDVIARLPGTSTGTVILGNHYDAWVLGALDPHSGTATLLAIARGLGELARSGWRPRRTILFGFWDAEEFGVLGSTAWVEDALPADAVAYFNIDTIKAGSLVVAATPALRGFVASCAGAPLAPAFKDLGIGSDWTAFAHHAGVPSLQWQTGAGTGVYDTWHSARDDVATARAKADPGFAFIPVFARVMGRCALRLADADALPLRYTDTAAWLEAALAERHLAVPSLRAAIASPTNVGRAAPPEAVRRSIDRFRAAAATAEAAGARCNAALVATERAFLTGDAWYRHLLVGPDPDNGYGALVLPEIAAGRDGAVDHLLAALDRATATLASCR